LYSYLVAKKTGGEFLLRIEDTDQARSVPGAVEQILSSLEWAGVAIDEGVVLDHGIPSERGPYGPYTQSKRLDLYQKYARQLLEQGHAYRCFCTAQRLDEMRALQIATKQPTMYDRLCMTLSEDEVRQRMDNGEPSVVRLKIPRERTIVIDDAIRGRLEFRGDTIDDQVLLKSDGFPTYHLAHVVDDHLMKIDLVIRGEEWLSSLPKHIILFEYFNWAPPQYAHVPLLLNPSRTKLSKRESAVSVDHFIHEGYLPEAMINFIALLGWNPGTEQEVFSLQELIDSFDVGRINKAGAIFDLTKLEWLQGQWLKKISLDDFAQRILPLVAAVHPAAVKDPLFLPRAGLIRERITLLKEAPEALSFFYEKPQQSMELLCNKKQGVDAKNVSEIITLLHSTLKHVDPWNMHSIERALAPHMGDGGWKKGQLLWVLRAVITGKAFSPGAYEVAAILGREETLKRLKDAPL
jgi:glutamyl-tRNA synthetase